jgi:hypothetical protein
MHNVDAFGLNNNKFLFVSWSLGKFMWIFYIGQRRIDGVEGSIW